MAVTSHIVPLEREADVHVAAEQAALVAAEAGFDRYACGDIETAVSEICSNAIRHADGGWAAIRRMADRLEVSVTDRGPGFGGRRKSAPGLRIGLEGAQRLMGTLDITHLPDGSRVTATRPLPPTGRYRNGPWAVVAASRSRLGRAACGDAVRAVGVGDTVRLAVADGLGSGLPAHQAATAILDAMKLDFHDSPADALRAAHLVAGDTRGASVAVVYIDGDGHGLHAALGDVSCLVRGEGELVSRPGMVGHGDPQPVDTPFRLHPHGHLLVWTDGLHRRHLTHLHRSSDGVDLVALETVVRENGNPKDDCTLVAVKRP